MYKDSIYKKLGHVSTFSVLNHKYELNQTPIGTKKI